MTWTVAGYRAYELVGFGASGEVWRAVHEATGDHVALKRLRVGAGADERRQLRQEAALLTALHHPHLLRLHEVIDSGEQVLLVLELAEGGSLGGLLARRGRLLPGEVVTALAPVADALATAHAHGVVHGDVSPGNVLLTADGRPLLADLGTARLTGDTEAVRATPGCADPALARGALPTPATDVYALAALAVRALTGAPPGADPAGDLTAAGVPAAMTAELLRCLDPVPARRPAAEAVGRTLLAGTAAMPLRSVAPVPSVGHVELTHAVAGRASRVPAETVGPVTGRHRAVGPPVRRGIRRPVVVTVIVVLVAVLIGLLGAGSAVHRPAGAPASPTVVGATDWANVVDDLDAHRADAFAEAAVPALRAVYTAQSPALVADAATVRRLAAAHEHASGVRHRLLGVYVLHKAADQVVLAVRDALPGYLVLDASGRVVQRNEGRGPRSMSVVLVRTGGAWRIDSMTDRA